MLCRGQAILNHDKARRRWAEQPCPGASMSAHRPERTYAAVHCLTVLCRKQAVVKSTSRVRHQNAVQRLHQSLCEHSRMPSTLCAALTHRAVQRAGLSE